MKNNLIALILILVITVSLFSGCGGPNNDTEVTTDPTKDTVSTSVSDITVPTPSTDYLQNETEPVTQKKGALTLEDCQNATGPSMYVLYSDGSLDELHRGAILNWGKYRAPQFGAFSENKDLIIHSSLDEQNPKINSNNKLVIFCTIDNDDYDETGYWVRYNIAPVLAKGCTISKYGGDDVWSAVFFGNNEADGSLYCSKYWRAGYSMEDAEESGFECTHINGIAVGDHPGIPLAEGTEYCNFQNGHLYKLSVVEGTALVEKEFRADVNYYFQGENTEIDITPTTDGYAVANLEDFTAGDYIVQIVWYDGDALYCRCTHITIE